MARDPTDMWDRQRRSLEALAAVLPGPPSALLVVSGHWKEPQFKVQKNLASPLLYDCSGIAPHTYELTWPAAGRPDLSDRVGLLLGAAGVPMVIDTARGFDHGVFIPLKVVWPQVGIPCVQLGLRGGLDPRAHLAAGEALAPLRERGMLIIGSGNTYHNMQKMMRAGRRDATGPVNGREFDRWLSDTVTCSDPGARDRALARWNAAPGVRDALSREEHLIPLMVAAGAAGVGRGTKTLEDHAMGGVLSAVRFG